MSKKRASGGPKALAQDAPHAEETIVAAPLPLVWDHTCEEGQQHTVSVPASVEELTETLASFSAATDLDLSLCLRLAPELIGRVVQQCPKLVRLGLDRQPSLDTACIQAIVDAVAALGDDAETLLTSFSFNGCCKLNDIGIKRLAVGIPGLRTLQLRGTAITDVGLSQMHNLSTLTELDLSSNICLTNQAVAALVQNTPKLLKLSLSNCRKVGDIACKAVATLCGSLLRLELGGTAVTDAGVAELATLAELQVLDLSNCAISDSGVNTLLSGLPCLRALELGRCSCADQGLGANSRRVSTQLNWCQQTCCGTTLHQPFCVRPKRFGDFPLGGGAVAGLLQRLTSLHSLGLSGSSINPNTIDALVQCDRLPDQIDLNSCADLNDQSIRKLLQFSPQLNSFHEEERTEEQKVCVSGLLLASVDLVMTVGETMKTSCAGGHRPFSLCSGSLDGICHIDYGIHDRDDEIEGNCCAIQNTAPREWVIMGNTQQATVLEAKHDETAAEDAPAEEAPAEEAPAEDAPAEDAPAEDAPAEDAPAEEATGDVTNMAVVEATIEQPDPTKPEKRGCLVLTANACGRTMLTLRYCHPGEKSNCTTHETIDVHVLVTAEALLSHK